MSGTSALGEFLVAEKIASREDVEAALEIQKKQGGSLIRALSNDDPLTEQERVEALARAMKLGCAELDGMIAGREVTEMLPAAFCRKNLVAPLAVDSKRLHVAVTDPLDYETLKDIEFRTSLRVAVAVASERALLAFLDRIHAAAATPPSAYELLAAVNPAGELEASEAGYESADLSKLSHDLKLPPIVRLVNMILSEAAQKGASDIHIEPQESSLQVRNRVDGLLRDVLTIPRNLQDSVISRVKIISGMDISERRRPQDGRSRLRFEGRRIDLRVSTLPTHLGEKVVIRLLDSSGALVELANLGFNEQVLMMMTGLLARPQGIILVTGPTGSGKTSTLYAALNSIKTPDKNIITVEDPIEYQLKGINQVQINLKAGMTFASGLRSILRQDPNIVLVGEIRDQETAGIAMEAAQTGHLLLSTLHTNDAAATITRLLDLGIEPYLAAASLTAILAQRLVRRTCTACATEEPPPAEAVEKAGGAARLPADAAWKAGAGCEACGDSGFKGRTALHELLVMDDAIRELITRRAPEHEIRRAARVAGMITLMEDGVAKAAGGLTTLDEVTRVAPPDDINEPQSPPTLFAPEPVAAAPMSEKPFALPAMPAAPTASDALHGAKILVVDDSPTVTTVIKYFLELEGFSVVIAEDGAAGLEAASREHPALIVSDVNMPGMDGITMVRSMRQDPALRNVPVLLLTSESNVDVEVQGLAVGADDFVLKPVEPRRLAARIKSLLGKAAAGAAGS